jgi:predicted transcriptional regulator
MRQFGGLEAVIMNRLWARDRPTLIRKAVDDLQKDRQIAYTTVMTVMDNLYCKGWLRRHRDGRADGTERAPRLGILTGSSRPGEAPM